MSEFADRTSAETWFGRHGLPYFVPETRHAVHAGLRPARLVLVALGAVALGAIVGGTVALASRVSWGVPSAMTTAGAVAALYALTTLRAGPIAGWGIRHTLGSLGLLVPLATRALPLLLLFVTFLFINAEVWELAARLEGGVLWLVVLLFTAIAAGFLLGRMPEELAATSESGEHRLTPFERANLVLVLLVAQAVQVLLLALALLAFFLVFGAMVMDRGLVESWTGAPPQSLLGIPNLTWELVQVSIFLAAFSGLHFTVTAVTDDLYRKEFFTTVTDELTRALRARTAYLELRDREPGQPTGDTSG
ncbi:hypothetical protein [Nocardioides massiliensis]|uniref:Uncharacterized protein n=1 Tax=Nocardioides massiliensis TaxID=1325935 RepID=A0ABT9NQB8_9ACTN|nr:hypothetical protein [Nocardioides massiliensis]MDP9822626.1 hypothetical protein [Nocardioides massiliensis]